MRIKFGIEKAILNHKFVNWTTHCHVICFVQSVRKLYRNINVLSVYCFKC